VVEDRDLVKQHNMQAPELELVDEAKLSTLLGMPTHIYQ